MLSSFSNKNELKKGSLLISEPFLPDSNFERTVILLCDHNEDGSIGFVLNKASDIVLNDAIEEFVDFNPKLYVGGPVEQNTLHFVYTGHVLEGALQIKDSVYWAGDFEQLKRLINTKQVKEKDIRFFLGYSGWAQGQLEKELKENSWVIYNPDSLETVWNMEPTELWRMLLKNMGGKFKIFSNYPIDPRLN